MNQLYAYNTEVKTEWVDHNGHMNDAEYNRVFSDATDDWLAYIGLDVDAIKTLNYTIFTLENHVTFLKEMKEHDAITVNVYLYDYDSKRLHTFMEMYDSNQQLAATYEVMLMGMDTQSERPAPFPTSIADNVTRYFEDYSLSETPKQLGHQIGITRRS
ncbi:putative thioesterase [Staphylococcus petrasii]|uniref:Thioesterase n=1 Tax=Staphylococcus petrasii TaxID=1276936 RepID=A0A380FV50_9STAP|nr:thioesterase family protein [Staphylococcus petrasii]PNZ30556.1 thioesterase [Staphylococcus petrasii]TGE12201.1 thioesterase [Staphylococcus petrasii]TGE17102.1 thioesterase [Staphylococcus petrasii]SUM42684.1 putative thioesterase [Staphylococcus petrasii]